MRDFDLTPLFRTSVGFDRLDSMFDKVLTQTRESVSYPPYNIIKTGENTYQVQMAIAGFTPEEIDITFQQNELVVSGTHAEKADLEEVEYLHKGIAKRSFEHKFKLDDHIRVDAADIDHGLLKIDLVREVPEALKPKKIAIGNGKIKSISNNGKK